MEIMVESIAKTIKLTIEDIKKTIRVIVPTID